MNKLNRRGVKKGTKIEILGNCKICGAVIKEARFRTYCSPKCRRKAYNEKRYIYGLNWQRANRAKIASVKDPNKCQCLICKGWYVQVGSHVSQVHGITARQYREQFNLEVKRGTTPKWYRKLKGEEALDNGTFENLKAGEKFRFEKGQEGVGVYKRSPVTIERLKDNALMNRGKRVDGSDLTPPADSVKL